MNETDSAALLDRLVAFREQGIASVLISHKLNEVARVADRITVLRDGRTVDSIDCRSEPIEEDRIIRSMVNRDLAHRFPERQAKIGETVLDVEGWSVQHPLHPERQVIKNVDFEVRRGEVVGIAGLMGAGRTEFAMSLFGRAWGKSIRGRVRLDGGLRLDGAGGEREQQRGRRGGSKPLHASKSPAARWKAEPKEGCKWPTPATFASIWK